MFHYTQLNLRTTRNHPSRLTTQTRLDRFIQEIVALNRELGMTEVHESMAFI
ncbi:hypothetical protein J6590_071791 [Homalodisca vitripennis]|nr:hypothetical protein J6590_071791 [Homalodisca vitripennis]